MSDIEPIFDEELLEDLKSLADEGEILPMALYAKFIETTEERLGQIKKYQQTNNFEEIKNIAHSLKGSSHNLAAKRMGNAASCLERASSEQNATLSEQYLQLLENEYQLVKDEIQRMIR